MATNWEHCRNGFSRFKVSSFGDGEAGRKVWGSDERESWGS